MRNVLVVFALVGMEVTGIESGLTQRPVHWSVCAVALLFVVAYPLRRRMRLRMIRSSKASDDSLHVSAWGGEERAGVRLFPASGEGRGLNVHVDVCRHRAGRGRLSGCGRPFEGARLPGSQCEAP